MIKKSKKIPKAKPLKVVPEAQEGKPTVPVGNIPNGKLASPEKSRAVSKLRGAVEILGNKYLLKDDGAYKFKAGVLFKVDNPVTIEAVKAAF